MIPHVVDITYLPCRECSVGWDFHCGKNQVEVLEKLREVDGDAFWRRRSGMPQPSGVLGIAVVWLTRLLSLSATMNLQMAAWRLYLKGEDDREPSEDTMNVKVRQYPQLRQLCWNRPGDAVVDGATALALYERNWRFVEQDALIPREQKLLDRLVAEYGNGHLLVA